MRLPLFVTLLALANISNAAAEPPAEPPAESVAESGLAPVYDRIAEDLRNGEPLVIAAHYGMWHARADQPDRNLNWGVYYGHATMMRRADSDRHIAKNYRHTDWELAYESKRESDPLRKLVWKTTVKPNGRWRKAGVDSPFEVYIVMYAWESQEDAAVAATRILRQGSGETLELDDGTRLDVGKAQVAGYFGHNFFYDYDDFDWDGFEAIEGTPDRAVGAFSVGCKTARVPGFHQWWSPKVVPFLFSRSLMASEGYSTLALVDGVLRRMDGRELVKHADSTYRYFQKLGKPDRRVGRPFVSRSYRFQK